MKQGISMGARREITRATALAYAGGTKGQKGVMLDSLCGSMGWSRANARRQLVAAAARKRGPVPLPKRRGRKYSHPACLLLERIWTLSGEPCGKYLESVMGDELERFVRFGELGPLRDLFDEAVRAELLAMSGATIDRYLKPVKDARYPAGSLSSTRPGSMLRSEIEVRWSGTPMEQEPGFFEVDTVAHCGFSLRGEFLYSITLTDVFTGWTVNTTVKNRAHSNVVAGVARLVESLPYPMRGLDFDNGGEFINEQLIEWADAKGYHLTRARAYKHNDNAHVEQRNNDWVRRHAFRYRYEDPGEMELLNRLWVLVDQRKNHLLPMVKADGYTTTAAGRRRRTYDKPRTAYRRLLDLGALEPGQAAALALLDHGLNPAAITREIDAIENQLIARAKLRTQRGAPGVSRAN